jgi:hypothetical protein
MAVIQLFRVIIGPAEYQDIGCLNHHRSASMFHSWNLAFKIMDFLECSPNINPARCSEQREGRLVRPYYIFPVRHPDFMIITPSFSPFSVAFSNQRFSNCSSTVDVGFMNPLRDCFRGSRVFWWILSSAVTFAAVLRFLDTIFFNVWRSFSLSFGFRPLFFLFDVFPWFLSPS